jgi:hypothetical protein
MRPVLLSSIVICLLVACEQNVEQAVSQVNGRNIGVDEFIFAYETSPRSVIAGPRESAYVKVLDRITERILLAQEAERRGLQNDPTTLRELRQLEDSAIRRELFKKHIRAEVQISEEDCRAAFLKSQQTLWVQYTMLDQEPSGETMSWDPDWESESINANVKSMNTPEYGLVNLVSWNELDQNLEDMLFSLEVGEMSAPLFKDKAYHIFRLVNTESNVMLSENEFYLKQEHYRSAIRKRREHARAFQFVKDVMQPEQLIIRRQTLDQLSNYLWQLHEEEEPKNVSSKELATFPNALDNLNGEELATYASGTMTVDDFRFYYRMNPYELNNTSLNELRNSIVNAIGIYVRDIVFAEKGRAENLASLPSVQEDFIYWRERLLAAKLENAIKETQGDVTADESEKSDLTANLAFEQLCDRLRKNAKIKMNEDVLMSIQTSDEGLGRKIDFFAGYLN